MALTDGQIERYSRQIIVARLGGLRQERVLGATMLLAGDSRDIEAPLNYLVGAGVGSIRLATPSAAVQSRTRLISNVKGLNLDVEVVRDAEVSGRVDVALVLIGSDDAFALAIKLARRGNIGAFVVARLDSAMVAILPGGSPCPRCADARLLAQFGARDEAADFLTMFATVEAFKLVAQYDENPGTALIEFSGYDTKTRAPASSSDCACNSNRRTRDLAG